MATNLVILLGNLGADPEVRDLPAGGKVANFRLATSETWKDKAGNRQERTEWHNVVFYGPVVEAVILPYVKKGNQLQVVGSLRTRNYEDAGEVKHFVTEIIGQDISLVGGRRTDSDAADAADNNSDAASNAGAAGNADTAKPAATKAAAKPAADKPAAAAKPAASGPGADDDFDM